MRLRQDSPDQIRQSHRRSIRAGYDQIGSFEKDVFNREFLANLSFRCDIREDIARRLAGFDAFQVSPSMLGENIVLTMSLIAGMGMKVRIWPKVMMKGSSTPMPLTTCLVVIICMISETWAHVSSQHHTSATTW
jgi:hypothetical protein